MLTPSRLRVMEIKSLHVIGSMDPASGGPCQVLRGAIPCLVDHGIQSEVVTFDTATESTYSNDPFPVHGVGPAKNPWVYSRRFLPWLKENLHRFDIVILHGLWLYNGFATSRVINHQRQAKGKNSPKFLIMSHGMLDPWFQRDPSRRLKAWRNWFYWKLIERETFRGYSPKRELNVGLGISEPPAETSPMHDAFFTACPSLNQRPYFLFISRIHPKKGVDLLLLAYAKLLQNVSQDSIQIPDLVIAGPTDSAYAQEMIRLAGRLNLLGEQQKVHFVGMLQKDSKWGAFYGCEAFLLPSHQENFGIAVAEALACSKPVLISDQVNIWREIESSGAGIVAHDNEEGTYELLDRWCRLTDQEKALMRSNARICYARHFDISVSTRRMAEAIKTVVNS
jgi:glycosyltransferase involved in cell wall biosynthesis